MPVAAAIAALGLAACDPPIPPDGRDLGLVIDTPPIEVQEGELVELTGSITNHGTVPATGVTMAYAVSGGFTVEYLDLGEAATCTTVSPAHTNCALNDALDPDQSLPFVVSATAGETSGTFTHLIAAGSDGTEPTPDPNASHAMFEVDVQLAAAEPHPVVMGSGTNYLGTGNLLSGSPRASEGFHLAVNPYCTDKVNGDRFQSGFNGNTCAGNTNADYRSSGYTYAIEAPPGRTSAIDVMLWDARYSDALSGGEVAVDNRRQAGTEPFTFTLYAADSTPLNASDNPELCSKTFSQDTPFDGLTYLGSTRWNSLCTITTAHPDGLYFLRVRNGGSPTVPEADGSNQFAVVARPVGAGTDPVVSLCDRATLGWCPVVSGFSETSISVTPGTDVARVPLGEVGAEQEGRRLNVELFDPGEGMYQLKVLAPAGPNSWAAMPFSWASDNGHSGSGTSLNVQNNIFNGRLVSIEVDLSGYQPPAGNDRWLVEYVAGPQGVVTDRTTWTAWISDHIAR